MLKLIVSKSEKKLLDATRYVRFGEMFSVEVPDGFYEVPEQLSTAEADLLNFIRSGHPHIDILSVHAGEPTCAEIDFCLNGFRCRKKARFPIP
jgi:hypothetical protein